MGGSQFSQKLPKYKLFLFILAENNYLKCWFQVVGCDKKSEYDQKDV